MNSDYFAVHAHSQFSGMDGMGKVKDMVSKVVSLGQPALSLTDHGGMPGTVQLYKECKKAGIAPFPGEEFYLVRDVQDDDTKGTRYHLGMLALDAQGYEAMAKLSSLSWQEDRFYYKPIIDLADLSFFAERFGDHVAVLSGCYSSMAVQALVAQPPGDDTARRQMTASLKMFKNWFPRTFYVELQNHGIDWGDGWTDAMIADELFVAATTLGLPVVMGGDSHYIEPEEQPVHDLMKDICYFGAGEDIHFSGGPYHLLSAKEAKGKFNSRTWDAIEDGHADLLDRHALTLPPLDNYKFQVPRMFKNAKQRLRELVEDALADKGLTSAVYDARKEHELHVIGAMGMDNYFLLVKTHITDWCRENDIIVNTRGSANGSLVCYALGITTVDPVQWNTSFPRFLSLDRMKPPDIDVDVDFRGRPLLVEHLRAVFPTMTQVGTYRQIGFSKGEDDKGSVIVQYMAAMRKKDPAFNGKVHPQHWDALNALAETPVYQGMGTNPSGFILPGDDYPIDKYLPLARIISSNNQVTQMSKDDVEALGYLKVDVLGLRALQTLNGTLVSIGHQPNDWDWIPWDDKDACALLRNGKGKGTFQYDGFTQGRGAQEMKVKSTLDVILGLALFRPALINGGQKDQYLENRGKSKARQVRLHPLFDKVVADTAGVPLYQEQIMEMLQVLGMQFLEYNELMTAIKASNGFIAGAADTFKRLQPLFYDLCEDKGFSDQDADDAWNAVIGFTEYGFNRAHSTSYGIMAYYSAFLKAHYPLEYMASLLAVWTGDKEHEPEYVSEARRMGYSVVKADVNNSMAEWTTEKGRTGALRKGLAAVKGIGWEVARTIVETREKGGPYTSIQDFIDRNPARPVSGGRDWKKKGELIGVCKTLYEANAFRCVDNK